MNLTRRFPSPCRGLIFLTPSAQHTSFRMLPLHFAWEKENKFIFIVFLLFNPCQMADFQPSWQIPIRFPVYIVQKHIVSLGILYILEHVAKHPFPYLFCSSGPSFLTIFCMYLQAPLFHQKQNLLSSLYEIHFHRPAIPYLHLDGPPI